MSAPERLIIIRGCTGNHTTNACPFFRSDIMKGSGMAVDYCSWGAGIFNQQDQESRYSQGYPDRCPLITADEYLSQSARCQ